MLGDGVRARQPVSSVFWVMGALALAEIPDFRVIDGGARACQPISSGRINAEYDVAGLCHERPTRVEELARRGGGKLAE